jgi:glucose/arabinose dehydrogenase
VPFQNGKPSGPPEDFAAGWLTDSTEWGRPVGVLQAPDGALLVSDDAERDLPNRQYLRVIGR